MRPLNTGYTALHLPLIAENPCPILESELLNFVVVTKLIYLSTKYLRDIYRKTGNITLITTNFYTQFDLIYIINKLCSNVKFSCFASISSIDCKMYVFTEQVYITMGQNQYILL